MTSTQIQTVLDNLIETYTTLSAEIASSVSMPAAQRSMQLRSLEEIQKQIAYWENRLEQVTAGTGGAVYAIRFEGAPN